jgi:hypothetical protein
MIKYKKYLNQFGWPIKTLPNFKIEKKYEPKIFLFSQLKRKFDVCLKIPSFELIDKYYGNNFIGSHYLDSLRKINLFKIINIQINFKLLSKLIFYISKKKIIKLKENEICLFGPYSHNYCHVIQEFFVRITFLSNKKDSSIIWLPDNLKKYLISDSYKKTFSDMKFKFYPTNKNLIFLNCNYLSHSNSRWLITNGKKKISDEYINLTNTLKKNVCKNHLFKYDSRYKHIIVSRSNSIRRKLVNEKELLNKLAPYNFKLVYFEKCDYETQINIARNCEIMIGYHGAGLTNLFFMKSKSLVLEILNENYPHEIYKSFSKALKINYKSFKCSKNYLNLDGVCDIKEITEYIKTKLR